jgi:TonB family protein
MKIFGTKSRDLTKEERFGLTVSAGTHLVLLVLFWMWYSTPEEQERYAFIEVTLGEFRDGSPAQQADVRTPEVATRPQPRPQPVTNPQPDPEPEPQRQVRPQEMAKPVEAPEQTQDIQTEVVIQSPETKKVDPEVREPEPQPRVQREPDPVQVEAEVERRGSLVSGDPRGLRGDMNAQQGTSRDTDRSAPYVLDWEGDINRQALSNPLPAYNSEVEAIITVRFTVKPDGTVGQIQPLRRTDPELEREVMRTLRTWRFNRLPSSVPQTEQNGVITFRFVLG